LALEIENSANSYLQKRRSGRNYSKC